MAGGERFVIAALYLLLGFGLLYLGGELLVRGAAALGLRFGLSPLVVGLTIVAFGTSSPELVVALDAAIRGYSEVAIGNVVGSNICNTGLILGIAALIHPLKVESKVVKFDAPIALVATVALFVMLYDGVLARIDGALLLAGIVAYTGFTLWEARRESGRVESEFTEEHPPSGHATSVLLLMIAGGLIALVIGGNLFVDGAVSLATALGVSQALIALTIVALGTSLPELATSIIASLRGHGDIAIGNVVGSNIFNILATLGVGALVVPLHRGDVQTFDLAAMLGIAILLIPLLYWRFTVGRWRGALLLVAYAAYIGSRATS